MVEFQPQSTQAAVDKQCHIYEQSEWTVDDAVEAPAIGLDFSTAIKSITAIL